MSILYEHQYMPLLFFLSIVRMSLKFPTPILVLSGQKKDTDVFGGTAEVLMSSGVVIMTNLSPLGLNQWVNEALKSFDCPEFLHTPTRS